ELPPIYFAHEREVFRRDGMLYATSAITELEPDEEPFVTNVRYRTVGDMSCTGAVESTAATLEEVVAEIAATRITERGETRADTPGHILYTRNMVTGASTADLAIVLIDARKGVLQQSRRHTFIASLLGVPHVVVTVNKMDLVGWDEDVFSGIVDDFGKFAAKL